MSFTQIKGKKSLQLQKLESTNKKVAKFLYESKEYDKLLG